MYKCEHCEYTSNRKYYVTLHNNIKHNDSINDLYKCNKCDKKLSSKQYLIKHQETCKGIINPSQCQKCNKVFSCTSSKCRHTKTCKAENKEDITPSIINNITNNNTTNITNNNTNNIINNTYIFQSDPNVHPLAYQNYDMQQLSNTVIVPYKNNLQLMMETFGRLLYNDHHNKNIKKNSINTKYCLVKNENGEWCNKLDKDIIPKATKDIAFNFRITIDNNEIELCNIDKKNKTILPKLIEFLSIIIDYNFELEILNDTDKEDDKLFNDMKDRTICIILDSSKCKEST
jgi:hypothetical protein